MDMFCIYNLHCLQLLLAYCTTWIQIHEPQQLTLVSKKTGWREGGREREWEREREIERERAREIETKRKLLLEHGLIVGGGSLSLGLPSIYIYTYFCVYYYHPDLSWYLVIIMFIVQHTKEKTYICIYSWCICKYNIIYSRWIQVTCTF